MTPLRMSLVVLAVASGVVVGYTLFLENSTLRLPLLVSALAVLGISLGILGFALAGTSVRVSESGRGGLGITTAFVAGLCVLIAAGALAGAIVLGILAAAA
jgi:hypothetical protein